MEQVINNIINLVEQLPSKTIVFNPTLILDSINPNTDDNINLCGVYIPLNKPNQLMIDVIENTLIKTYPFSNELISDEDDFYTIEDVVTDKVKSILK